MISAVKVGEFSLEIEMKLRTPFGRPASSKISTTIDWLRGLSSEDLRTAVLPHKMGVAIALKANPKGAFQGAIPTLDDKESQNIIQCSQGGEDRHYTHRATLRNGLRTRHSARGVNLSFETV